MTEVILAEVKHELDNGGTEVCRIRWILLHTYMPLSTKKQLSRHFLISSVW